MFGFGKGKKDVRAGVPDAPTYYEGKPHSRVRRMTRDALRSVANQMFKSSGVNPLDQWTATPISPDQIISLRQPVLVARSRDQWSNNDYIRAFVRLVRTNIVGPHGVMLQAQAKKGRGGGYDKIANKAIETAFAAWSKAGSCDVTGKLSWRAVQALAAETAARDGEYIIRKVYGADAGPWGFALQVIDPQRLPVRYDNARYGDSGNFVRQGIEFNKFGRPVAYHFSSTDEYNAYYYTIDGRGFERVPADEIIHGFVTEMAGQRRGLPWASTSLFRMHHLGGFEDAAVQNARAGATKMGFIQYAEGFGPEVDEDTEIRIDAEPLAFHELPEGATFQEFNPQYPNGEFHVFHKAMLRGAAAGMGVLYNNLASDLEGVNFSSIRQGTLDEREHWKECQEWLIEGLIEPVFAAWLPHALLSGRIKAPTGRPLDPAKLAAYSEVCWQPRRWAWIDPNADVKADVAAKNNLLKAPSQIIRESGRDPVMVYEQIAEDIKQMAAAGIPDEFIKASILPEQWRMTVPADASSVGGTDPAEPANDAPQPEKEAA